MRLPFVGAELLAPALGAVATLLAAYASVRMGAQVGLGVVLAVALFIGSVLGFLLAPHLLVALTIPVFALVPFGKLFVSPQLGPVKDLLTLAAISATLIVIAIERGPDRRRALPDNWILVSVMFLLGLYVVNVGGGHNVAWAHGVRLTVEPLLLLIVGLTLPNPRRTLRYALVSLVAMACVMASYGLVQQALGPWRLQGWGYSFDSQLRTYHGHLRSFGTLDDPFVYAAFLLFGLVAVLFWFRRLPLALLCGGLLAAGLVSSYVRTAALIVVALAGLWIGRKGYMPSAVLIVAAAVAATGSILVTSAGATKTTSYQSGTSSLTLNGRTSAWRAALGPPSKWPFGQGVGKVGTAAERATYSLTPGAHHQAPTRAVDSGYLATIADVGLVGVAVLLALFGRLIALAWGAVRRGRDAGWVALGLLAVFMLDAVTRSSFTGFPTAFLGLLLIGVALAAAAQVDRLPEENPGSRGPA
jgi:O-antigen ligase